MAPTWKKLLLEGDALVNPMANIGDMIYGDVYGAPTQLVGSTAASQKFLAQTGDGTNSAAPSWQPPPVAGLLTYFLTAAGSDIVDEGTDKLSSSLPTGGFIVTPSSFSNGTDFAFAWGTDAGVPNLQELADGLIHVHLHANKSNTVRVVKLYAEIWDYTAGGSSNAKIATTETSAALTTTVTEYDLFANLNSAYILAAQTSRIVVRFYAIVSGGGTDPSVNFVGGGTFDSRIELPSATIDATNFVPYSGAAKDTDLGAHNLSASQLTSVVAIGTPPLVVTSTTNIPHLNADTVDGSHASAFVTSVTGTAPIAASAGQTPAISLNIGQGLDVVSTNLVTKLAQVIGYGTGTGYTFTNAGAKIAFSTTSPEVDLPGAGTYLLVAFARVEYVAATFAAATFVNDSFYRSNNTPGFITNGTSGVTVPIMTTLTGPGGNLCWFVVYATANVDDHIEQYGKVNVLPSAGSIAVSQAGLVAIRLY